MADLDPGTCNLISLDDLSVRIGGRSLKRGLSVKGIKVTPKITSLCDDAGADGDLVLPEGEVLAGEEGHVPQHREQQRRLREGETYAF